MAPYLGNLSLWLSLFFAISQFFVAKKNKKKKFINICVIGLLISSLTSFSTLKDVLGVTSESIKTGKYMDLYSSFKQLSDDERTLIQKHQDHYYQDIKI